MSALNLATAGWPGKVSTSAAFGASAPGGGRLDPHLRLRPNTRGGWWLYALRGCPAGPPVLAGRVFALPAPKTAPLVAGSWRPRGESCTGAVLAELGLGPTCRARRASAVARHRPLGHAIGSSVLRLRARPPRLQGAAARGALREKHREPPRRQLNFWMWARPASYVVLHGDRFHAEITCALVVYLPPVLERLHE